MENFKSNRILKEGSPLGPRDPFTNLSNSIITSETQSPGKMISVEEWKERTVIARDGHKNYTKWAKECIEEAAAGAITTSIMENQMPNAAIFEKEQLCEATDITESEDTNNLCNDEFSSNIACDPVEVMTLDDSGEEIKEKDDFSMSFIEKMQKLQINTPKVINPQKSYSIFKDPIVEPSKLHDDSTMPWPQNTSELICVMDSDSGDSSGSENTMYENCDETIRDFNAPSDTLTDMFIKGNISECEASEILSGVKEKNIEDYVDKTVLSYEPHYEGTSNVAGHLSMNIIEPPRDIVRDTVAIRDPVLDIEEVNVALKSGQSIFDIQEHVLKASKQILDDMAIPSYNESVPNTDCSFHDAQKTVPQYEESILEVKEHVLKTDLTFPEFKNSNSAVNESLLEIIPSIQLVPMTGQTDFPVVHERIPKIEKTTEYIKIDAEGKSMVPIEKINIKFEDFPVIHEGIPKIVKTTPEILELAPDEKPVVTIEQIDIEMEDSPLTNEYVPDNFACLNEITKTIPEVIELVPEEKHRYATDQLNIESEDIPDIHDCVPEHFEPLNSIVKSIPEILELVPEKKPIVTTDQINFELEDSITDEVEPDNKEFDSILSHEEPVSADQNTILINKEPNNDDVKLSNDEMKISETDISAEFKASILEETVTASSPDCLQSRNKTQDLTNEKPINLDFADYDIERKEMDTVTRYSEEFRQLKDFEMAEKQVEVDAASLNGRSEMRKSISSLEFDAIAKEALRVLEMPQMGVEEALDSESQDDEFVDADEYKCETYTDISDYIFQNDEELDALGSRGMGINRHNLARNSLFMKFDPLLANRQSLAPFLAREDQNLRRGNECALINFSPVKEKKDNQEMLMPREPLRAVPLQQSLLVDINDTVNKSTFCDDTVNPNDITVLTRTFSNQLRSGVSAFTQTEDEVILKKEAKQTLQMVELKHQDEQLRKSRELDLIRKEYEYALNMSQQNSEEANCKYSMSLKVNQYTKGMLEQIVQKKARMEEEFNQEIASLNQKHLTEIAALNTQLEMKQSELSESDSSAISIMQKCKRLKESVEAKVRSELTLKDELATVNEQMELIKSTARTTFNKFEQQFQIECSERDQEKKKHEAEIDKLTIMLKMAEMKILSLNESVEKKDNECSRLQTILQEVTDRFGR